MNKTIIYLVLLAVLGLGVWYFLFSDKNVFGVNEAGFKVTDTGNIGKIFMADKSGNTITLERKDTGWVLNSQYPALASPLKMLLETLAEQEAMYPVPENMHNMVVKSMAAKGVKVELYKRNGRPMEVFYVSGQVGTISGSYMLMEGAKRPYVVQIPGFEGYLTSRYSTDAKDWRDRTVFRIPQQDLRSVAVNYTELPLNNYVLTQDAQGKVAVTVDPQLSSNNAFNERRAKVYTQYFENVNCEGYLNGFPHLDSVIAQAPKRCSMEVTDKNGGKQHLDIYWVRKNKRSKNLDTPDPDIPDEFDSDRFYATINNYKDTVVIQRTSFDKLLRRGFEFYQPDDQHHSGPDTVLMKHTFKMPQ